MKKLALLGATGSIGLSTLEVLRALPGRFELVSISSANNWQKLAQIAAEFQPQIVAIANAEHLEPLQAALSGTACKVLSGPAGVIEAAIAPACGNSGDEQGMLLSAAVGSAGLKPTLAAIDADLDIALANKETLVMAGEIVTRKARDRGVRLLPVDSEHSALFQCLECGRREEVRRLVLTASGGAFRGRKRAGLAQMKAKDALEHPTWNMGQKVTIDSATLANKALEVIEAHWLFGFAYDNIKVVIHPQSIVHSLVEYIDGAIISQLGPTDMKIPIQYALTFPERAKSPVPPIELAAMGTLNFMEVDRESFPCLDLGYQAGRQGGTAPAVYSAANEAAVELFLQDKIAFLEIADCIKSTLDAHPPETSPTLEDIQAADTWAREYVLEICNAKTMKNKC